MRNWSKKLSRESSSTASGLQTDAPGVRHRRACDLAEEDLAWLEQHSTSWLELCEKFRQATDGDRDRLYPSYE
jgi:hypothetical protein